MMLHVDQIQIRAHHRPAETRETITDEDPEVKQLLKKNSKKLWNAILFNRENICLGETEEDSSHSDPVLANAVKNYQPKY